MSQPLQYTVPPARTETTAQEELARLLQTCHEHGLLRFANDVVGSNVELAQTLVGGLKQPGALNAIQNVSILAMALSRIPPEQFYKLVFALKDAALAFGTATRRESEDEQAPGLKGAYRMLHDDSLWHALQPLVEALKVFSAGIERPADPPISAFSGKERVDRS